MFAAQRISLLKKIVLEKKNVDVAALCSALEVSDVTVRKYLDQLEREGFLMKVHGGAILAQNVNQIEETADREGREYTYEEERIADTAVSIIENGENIFLGSGKICTLIASKLYDKRNISVLTNNLDVVKFLEPYIKSVTVFGGKAMNYNGNLCTYGVDMMVQISRIYVTKAFFCVDGIDIDAGITMNNNELSLVMEWVSNIAAQKVILSPSCNFSRKELYRVNELEYFDIYITDMKIDGAYKTYFYGNDLKLIEAIDI